MATTPQFTSAPRVAIITLSVQNPNRDGTGAFGVGSFQAAPQGSRLDRMVIKASGRTTAGLIRLFLTDGAKTVLVSEVQVEAVNPSESLPAFEGVSEFLGGLAIPAGFSFKVSTEKADAINVSLFGGDF